MLYTATIHYSSPIDPGEHSSKILFEANDMKQACVDVGRWYENRHTCVPEEFGTLFCVKIYATTVQRIDSSGYLPPDTGMRGYEWKCDTGKPYGS